MDAKKFDESIVYSGKGANENNYLAQKVLTEGAFNFDELLGLTPEAFKKAMDERQAAAATKLEKSKLDSSFIALQKKGMEMETMQMTQMFEQKQKQLKLNNSQSPSFERGVNLIRICQKALQDAEHKVQILIENNGTQTLELFADE